MPSRYRAAIDHLQQAAAILGQREAGLSAVRLTLEHAVGMLQEKIVEKERRPAWSEAAADDAILKLDPTQIEKAADKG